MPHPTPANPDASPRTLTERQLAMLSRLAEIGMAIAEAAGQRAATLPEGGDPTPANVDPGLTFARAARAVRLTIALQQRLSQDLAAVERGEAATRAARADRRRDRIHDMVERAIEAAHNDGAEREDEIERLSSHVWERLTETDDADLIDTPLAEVVARICRDLGLPPQDFAAPFALRTADGVDGRAVADARSVLAPLARRAAAPPAGRPRAPPAGRLTG